MEAHEYDEWTKTSSHQSHERCIINYDERIKNFLNMNIELKPVSHAALVDRLSTGPSGCYGNDLSLKVSVLNWQEGTLQTKFRLQIPTPIEKALLSAFESQNYIRKNIIKNFLPNHWRWFEIFRIRDTGGPNDCKLGDGPPGMESLICFCPSQFATNYKKVKTWWEDRMDSSMQIRT